MGFLARATGFLEAAHVATTVMDAEPGASRPQRSAIVGFALGVVVVLLVLVGLILVLR
jgi:hypothetical protein